MWARPIDSNEKQGKEEMTIPEIYPVIDNDLARDNMENDIPAADLEDLDQVVNVKCGHRRFPE